jgi:hypothetical protein
MVHTLAAAFSTALQAQHNCTKVLGTSTDPGIRDNASEWQYRWVYRIKDLTREFMPHGSGFDNGTEFDFSRSKPQRLVFTTSFHHMNENGFYDGWTEHTVIVTPTFEGIELRITGRNRNDWKDYAYDVFHQALSETREGWWVTEKERREREAQAGGGS